MGLIMMIRPLIVRDAEEMGNRISILRNDSEALVIEVHEYVFAEYVFAKGDSICNAILEAITGKHNISIIHSHRTNHQPIPLFFRHKMSRLDIVGV